ncbi:glycosyltransferase [Cohnella sp. CFH 77786]|uniref:glycosyltransferase family 4 protein n=1 Tax=Cohnella sp. CFH 77786 TaxID=2662265 RepID=UPI001C60CD2D|nr:glycosyltransferase family 1 protein [Cohnella sp. CFH 77786]MBW5447008.1 glycosyltransferase [Cohnella sp. CFH 77786]
MAELRLALFTDTYAPEINGVAKTLERWTNYLRKEGIEFLVFAPSHPRGESPFLETAERLASRPFFLYPETRFALPRLAEAQSKLLRFRPTAIHVATPFGIGLTGRQLALRHGIPLFASHHTHFVRYLSFYNLQWLGTLLWRYLHWFHRPSRRVFVPSRSVLEECEEHGWKGLAVWSRGVDTSVFRPADDREALRQALGLDVSRFTVLYAGRMAPEKQAEVAVEAIKLLERDHGLGAELVMAGDGPSAAALRTLAARRKVPVRFPGALPQPELRRWMAACDALIFPSPTETFGNVVLEAMACGLPVVGANAGAVPDTVRHGEDGLLCEPGDAGAFAAALARLGGDPALREKLAEAGLRQASARSWDRVFAGLLEEIRAACSVFPATF